MPVLEAVGASAYIADGVAQLHNTAVRVPPGVLLEKLELLRIVATFI